MWDISPCASPFGHFLLFGGKTSREEMSISRRRQPGLLLTTFLMSTLRVRPLITILVESTWLRSQHRCLQSCLQTSIKNEHFVHETEQTSVPHTVRRPSLLIFPGQFHGKYIVVLDTKTWFSSAYFDLSVLYSSRNNLGKITKNY